MNIPVTEWFPAEVEPKRKGVYQKINKSTGTLFFSNWNGKFWGLGSIVDDVAALPSYANNRTANASHSWRGLSSPHPEWKP